MMLPRAATQLSINVEIKQCGLTGLGIIQVWIQSMGTLSNPATYRLANPGAKNHQQPDHSFVLLHVRHLL
jgi:hypothetical protein